MTKYYIRTLCYTYNGEQKVGYVIYRIFRSMFCLCFKEISICPDIECLNEAKKILGINLIVSFNSSIFTV